MTKGQIEQAAREYAERKVNGADKSTYSVHEKMKLNHFNGYDIEEMYEEIAKEVLSNQWISVEDMPPEGTHILAFLSEKFCGVENCCALLHYYEGDGLRNPKGYYEHGENVPIEAITNWMEIHPLTRK